MLRVTQIKECEIDIKINNDVQIQKEDIKSISVVVTLANCDTEIDSCMSIVLAKNINFSVEGDMIIITFDAIVNSSTCNYFNYIVDSFSFAAIDIETDKVLELDEEAVITYICDDIEKVADLSILHKFEDIDIEKEKHDNPDEDHQDQE